MQRKIKKYLYDIQAACLLVEQFTKGKSFSDYVTDFMLKSAVERQFEIIGEALNQMLRLEPKLDDFISDSKRIISFRNYLIHGYSDISDEVVWGITEKNLPLLKKEIEKLTEFPEENGK